MDKALGITSALVWVRIPSHHLFFEKCLVPGFFHRWNHIQYRWTPSNLYERHRHLMNTIDATIRQFINSKTPKMGSSVNESILVPTPLWSYWFEYWFEWCTFRRVSSIFYNFSQMVISLKSKITFDSTWLQAQRYLSQSAQSGNHLQTFCHFHGAIPHV